MHVAQQRYFVTPMAQARPKSRIETIIIILNKKGLKIKKKLR